MSEYRFTLNGYADLDALVDYLKDNLGPVARCPPGGVRRLAALTLAWMLDAISDPVEFDGGPRSLELYCALEGMREAAEALWVLEAMGPETLPKWDGGIPP